jgi:outer membrane receptor protein involved in Fe transport
MNYAYTSKFYWFADNRQYQRPVGLLDASVSYYFDDDTKSVKLWGSNLTQEEYYMHAYEPAGPPGDLGAVAAPRTFGIQFAATFGKPRH